MGWGHEERHSTHNNNKHDKRKNHGMLPHKKKFVVLSTTNEKKHRHPHHYTKVVKVIKMDQQQQVSFYRRSDFTAYLVYSLIAGVLFFALSSKWSYNVTTKATETIGAGKTSVYMGMMPTIGGAILHSFAFAAIILFLMYNLPAMNGMRVQAVNVSDSGY